MGSNNNKKENDQKEKDIQAIKSLYDISITTRNFEITQLIQRNNFFMLFQGVLLASALQNQASKPIVEAIICFTGLFVSIYQLQMASGAKFWQEWWESRVDEFEKILVGKLHDVENRDPYLLFTVPMDHVEKTIRDRLIKDNRWSLTNLLILRRFSVSRAPMKVSIVLLLTWLVLLIHSINFTAFSINTNCIKGFYFSIPPSQSSKDVLD